MMVNRVACVGEASDRQVLRSPGLLLLEVLLALAILTGSILLIGQLVDIGASAARVASDATTAQMIATELWAEIDAGMLLPDRVADMPVPEDNAWQYSISTIPMTGTNLVAVTVRVQRAERRRRSTGFELTRWIPDPLGPWSVTAETSPSETGGSDSSTSADG